MTKGELTSPRWPSPAKAGHLAFQRSGCWPGLTRTPVRHLTTRWCTLVVAVAAKNESNIFEALGLRKLSADEAGLSVGCALGGLRCGTSLMGGWDASKFLIKLTGPVRLGDISGTNRTRPR